MCFAWALCVAILDEDMGGQFDAEETALVAELCLMQGVVTLPRVTDGLLAERYPGARLLA